MRKLPTDRAYILDRDFKCFTGLEGYSFMNNEFLLQSDGLITIYAGFEFDGASFAPDGKIDAATGKPRAYYPALVHDVLYKHYPAHGIPRSEIDKVFLRMLRDYGFKPAWLYFSAVKLLGGVYLWTKGRKKWTF